MLLAACGQGAKTTTTTNTSKVVNTVTTTSPDTAYFDKSVAIVIEPSDRLINIVKSKQEESSYSTVVQDDVFYLTESNHYLDSVKANKVKRESEGSVKFKTLTGQTYIMKLDTIFLASCFLMVKINPLWPI